MRRILGKRLRNLRLERNFSQEAVAGELGVSPQTLSTWERGTRAVGLQELATAARYFEVDLRDLVHGLEHIPKKR